MFYEVIPEGKLEVLTYHFDASLLPGQIISVPVGRRTVPGVVVKKVAQPAFKTRSILKVLYAKPLPQYLLNTVRFIHEYYLAPTGQALSLVLPRGVEKKRRKTEHLFGKTGLGEALTMNLYSQKTEQDQKKPQIQLNLAQKNALKALYEAPGTTKLLFGVTGSGKTNIYLKMAEKALSGQKSTILLVPEIALTSQLVRVFREVFGEKVLLMHSRQTEAERHLIFEKILLEKGPFILIGPRSALFAPLANLGLIIIDEEHESAYHQENAPKYSAIRVASFIAKEVKCPLILGSATPTIEDFYIATRQKTVVKLSKKAKTSALKPNIKIIDFKNRENFTKNKYFSNSLLNAISDNLDTNRQTLIFHNRRGSSPLTICDNCGEEILCPNCYLPLTLHADTYQLVCHTCGFKEKVPGVCPECKTPGLIHKGFGTKLLESELKRLFPKAQVRRFDADNKKHERLEEAYTEIRDGKIDILVGTQTLAKGLDLPQLATVGIVQADAGLSLPDYLAEERTFQLITQVIGRVGRGHLSQADVFIQTFRPQHPVLKFAAQDDYLSFYEYDIARRQKSGFPPFKFVMKLEITMKTEAIVLKKIEEIARRLNSNPKLIVSPPQPAFHERNHVGHTWQLIVRARSRKALVGACEGLDKNFRITLDPPGLL